MTEIEIPNKATHAAIEALYAHAMTHSSGEEEPCCMAAGLAAAYPVLAAQWRQALADLLDKVDLEADEWERLHNPECECRVAQATRTTVARIRPLAAESGDRAGRQS